MKGTPVSVFVLPFLAILSLPFCAAQTDPWERVRLIEPGKKVDIIRTDGKSVSGRMHEWSADAVSVRRGRDKVVRVSKAEVESVAMVAGMSRLKKAGWAAGIGGGIGFALFAGLCGASECLVDPAVMGVAGGILVSGISAGVAALIPAHKEVIYSVRGKRSAAGPSGATGTRSQAGAHTN